MAVLKGAGFQSEDTFGFRGRGDEGGRNKGKRRLDESHHEYGPFFLGAPCDEGDYSFIPDELRKVSRQGAIFSEGGDACRAIASVRTARPK
jgi:hypothetical protein